MHARFDVGGARILRECPPAGNVTAFGQGADARQQRHRTVIGALPGFKIVGQGKWQVGLVLGNGGQKSVGRRRGVVVGGREAWKPRQAFGRRPDRMPGVVKRALPVEATPAAGPTSQ